GDRHASWRRARCNGAVPRASGSLRGRALHWGAPTRAVAGRRRRTAPGCPSTRPLLAAACLLGLLLGCSAPAPDQAGSTVPVASPEEGGAVSTAPVPMDDEA